MPRRARPIPDRHVLYTRAVQQVDAEIDFVDATFTKLRRRKAARLREDFCGTAATSCEWVRRRPTNTAVGVDLDGATLKWGIEHNLSRLHPGQGARVHLLQRDVRRPGAAGHRMDAILAMNFSYWVFKTRAELRGYFASVRRSLVRDGVFFLDIYGGWECGRVQRERRPIGGKKRGFTYIWEQAEFDPITGHLTAKIHFRLLDGTRIRDAFTYDWRLWTLPEVREILSEAGFRRSTVYWEGDDGKGGGNGVFTAAERGESCPSFIAFIVAEK